MIWIDLEHKLPTDTNIPNWIPWTIEKWNEWLATSVIHVKKMTVLHQAGKIVERNKYIDDNSTHWGKLKPWLQALSYGKCWFSEAKETFSHYDVEHFRPKKKVKILDESEKDGYWWLAFDYMNFRLCGNVGNSKKGVWFPLRVGSMCASYDNRCEECEINYLLDPIDAADVSLLSFDDEGKAISAPGISDWDRERVEETVKHLKLNAHSPLTEARRQTWQEVINLITQFEDNISKSAQGPNPVAKDRARDAARQIREKTQPHSPFSSVAKWCVRLSNNPRLSSLV